MGILDNSSAARASSLFGNYDILETLGQGGMGVVYRAHDITLDRIVAVKVLKDDLRTQKSVVARFQREGEAIATLNHPNIVHVFSVGTVGKIPYIAMQYVEGEPLSRTMKRVKRIKWDHALAIVQQVAEALYSAHEAQIIHRDIKPGNILIDGENNALVTDFGIAKVLTAETQLTVDGARLGTPQYMSPERCLNKSITPSSDIYSLGVVLFQMISGKLPYNAETPISLIREITSTPPKRLREYVPSVPKDVERIAAWMLEKDPRNRPKNARELADAVGRVRKGQPLTVGDSGMTGALEELRGGMVTPTAQYEAPTAVLEERKGRVRQFLESPPKMSKSVRELLISGLVIILAALIGVLSADWINRDFAVGLVQRLDSGTTAWQQSPAPMDFTDLSPGVALVTLNLKDFEIAGGGWFAGNRASMSLNGRKGSRRAGDVAGVILDPVGRSSSLSIVPVPGASITVMSASVEGMSAWHKGAMLMPSTETEQSLGFVAQTSASGETILHPVKMGDVRIDAMAMSPRANVGVASVTDSEDPNRALLIEFSVSDSSIDLGGAVALTGPGAPIEWIEYSRDGGSLYFLRGAKDVGGQLRVLQQDGRRQERVVREGKFEISSGAIHPAGTNILITQRDENGIPSVRVFDAQGRNDFASIQGYHSAMWRADGASILGLAPDQAGLDQLWGIAFPSLERTQLTALEGGIETLVGVSASGDWVLATAHGDGTSVAVVIDLTKLLTN